MQNTSARNNSIRIELTIFASLYQAKEELIFYVHFLSKNFLFTWRGRSGVAFLSYEKGFGGEKFRGPRGRSRAFVCGLSSPVLGLHSVGRLTSGRFCRVCFGTGDFLRPQEAIPHAFTPFEGVGFIAWCLRRPKKGNADGAEGIFGLAGCVWASALRPDPP